jgi:hypothetical protein
VNTMLVKKTYGCLTLKDYQEQVPPPTKKGASRRYSKLNTASKSAPARRLPRTGT